ncbi:hypothetical protein [Deinococcus murrayi]|uniref:hypothetical protein n=1 Tax=Deinococcus murrayi TaxID=68910 RepID=UPI000684DFD3|nr:hypothetical protein [Deinococcus murrayi]
MSQPPADRCRPLSLRGWGAALRAWPGVLTLLSVLAVLLGQQAPAPAEGGSGPRVAAVPVAPALPEFRAAPAPAPAGPGGLPLGTPPAPRWQPPPQWAGTAPPRAEGAFRRPLSLALLGRRQTDGG